MMNEFDKELEAALAGHVQITNIGYVTDEKPKDKVWFTAQDRLFVLDFTEAKKAIKLAFLKHVVEDDEDRTHRLNKNWIAEIDGRNYLRHQQRQKLKGES